MRDGHRLPCKSNFIQVNMDIVGKGKHNISVNPAKLKEASRFGAVRTLGSSDLLEILGKHTVWNWENRVLFCMSIPLPTCVWTERTLLNLLYKASREVSINQNTSDYQYAEWDTGGLWCSWELIKIIQTKLRTARGRNPVFVRKY